MKTLLLAFFALSLATTAAMAAENETHPFASWRSSAHLGFNVEDRSTTGFKNAAGTALFMDLTRAVHPRLQVGLRTLGTGGQVDNHDYSRLGTGPMLQWSLSEKWSLHAAYGIFNETGRDSGAKAYRSHGQALMLGWERHVSLNPKLELAWGGYWARHWGDMESLTATTATLPTTAGASQRSSQNVGGSRGIEIALRMSL